MTPFWVYGDLVGQAQRDIFSVIVSILERWHAVDNEQLLVSEKVLLCMGGD